MVPPPSAYAEGEGRPNPPEVPPFLPALPPPKRRGAEGQGSGANHLRGRIPKATSSTSTAKGGKGRHCGGSFPPPLPS